MITFKVPALYGLAMFVVATVFWAGFLIGKNGAIESSTLISPPFIEACPFGFGENDQPS